MAAPPWLADEMVGRLARYLRMLGHDTAYARGLTDGSVAEWARREGRTILTRDRALARAVDGSLLLRSTGIGRQLREVRTAAPTASWAVTFERCTLCNGELGVPPPEWKSPPTVRPPPDGVPLHLCEACGHVYWDGSHTASVRRHLQVWLEGTGA